MVEVLGKLISKMRLEGRWHGVKVVNGIYNLSHLQLVDDTFILGEVSFREAQIVISVLNRYNKDSSQCVNWRKSEVFFFSTSLQK